MEQIAISVLFGFLGGAVLMFFMKDKVTAFDASLHAKIDQLIGKTDANAQAVANHVTAQVANISGQIAQIDEKIAPKVP